MIEKYFLKIHTLLIALYAISTVVNFNDLNYSLFFYPRYILSQPWVMFSPDPQSFTYSLAYKCENAENFQHKDLFLSFWEKQNGVGKRKAQLYKTVYLAAIKRQKFENKSNNELDLILLDKAEELIRIELQKYCPNTLYKNIEIRYDQINFLSQQ